MASVIYWRGTTTVTWLGAYLGNGLGELGRSLAQNAAQRVE